MIIFSCGRDCLDSVEKHMNSIYSQTFQDFHHIVVDDASKGNNLYKKIHQLKNEKTIIYKNKKNNGWLKNAIDYLIPFVNDLDIVVVVDLDDWLYDDFVLQKILNIYKDPTVHITFGSYIRSDEMNKKIKYPDKSDVVITLGSDNIRKEPWVFSHLKTFKGFLIKKIKDESFRGPDGEYMKCSYDRAIMYPMIEMVGIEHIRYIDDIMYIYNVNVSNNVYKIYPEMQVLNKKYISEQQKYEKSIHNIL